MNMTGLLDRGKISQAKLKMSNVLLVCTGA